LIRRQKVDSVAMQTNVGWMRFIVRWSSCPRFPPFDPRQKLPLIFQGLTTLSSF
jgi:hypothetical protein